MIRCDATPGEPRTVRFLQTARHGNWINTCVALLCDGRPEMRGAWFGGPTHARCAAFGAFAMERGGVRGGVPRPCGGLGPPTSLPHERTHTHERGARAGRDGGERAAGAGHHDPR